MKEFHVQILMILYTQHSVSFFRKIRMIKNISGSFSLLSGRGSNKIYTVDLAKEWLSALVIRVRSLFVSTFHVLSITEYRRSCLQLGLSRIPNMHSLDECRERDAGFFKIFF